VANYCGNVHVRFSTFFYFRKRRKNKKTLKNVKKRFLHLCYPVVMLPMTLEDGCICSGVVVVSQSFFEFCLFRAAVTQLRCSGSLWTMDYTNKKHLKNVGPICHCEPPHAHSPGVATVARAHRCPRQRRQRQQRQRQHVTEGTAMPP